MGALYCECNSQRDTLNSCWLCCYFFLCVNTLTLVLFYQICCRSFSLTLSVWLLLQFFFKLPFRLGVIFFIFFFSLLHTHSMHRHTDIPILVFFHSKLVHFSKSIHTFSYWCGVYYRVYTVLYMDTYVVLCVLLIKVPRCNRFKTGQFPIQIAFFYCMHTNDTYTYVVCTAYGFQRRAHLNANAFWVR